MYKNKSYKRSKQYIKKLRNWIKVTYNPSIPMIKYLQNACLPNGLEQPGSLTKTYFYQYDKSKKEK